MIYIIKSGQYLKIGYCSKLHQRMRDYIANNPDVELLGINSGDKNLENLIQKECYKYNYRTEWFKYNENVINNFNKYISIDSKHRVLKELLFEYICDFKPRILDIITSNTVYSLKDLIIKLINSPNIKISDSVNLESLTYTPFILKEVISSNSFMKLLKNKSNYNFAIHIANIANI